ncbi:MAG: TetR/AcrR family transcriptional regulator [Chitinophagaceae bacterium]
MGIAERKSKHKADLKQSILDAAKKVFLESGYEATSIRKIAAEIEFSPTTIYLYYKDKNEIAHALHEEGFKILSERFSVLAHVEHPFERLKAMGRIYMQFALENRDYYEIMFIMKDPIAEFEKDCPDKEWDEGKRALNILLETVQQCQQAGYFKGFEPNAFSLVVWSTMHGLCTMKTHGQLDLVVKKKEMLTDVADAFTHTFECFIQLLERLK